MSDFDYTDTYDVEDYILLEEVEDERNTLRQQAVKLNNEAVRTAQAGDLEKALILLNKAVDRDPYIGAIYYNRYLMKKNSVSLDFLRSLGFDMVTVTDPSEFAHRLKVLNKSFNLLR